ncbi:MAG: hypothetical protein HYS81_04210 [Candidatus Aenigmatarchaeota archaeon]|nr:MAG: hypothetical protein HYS81_04210 [Candidatus Aenigmarchaeota archaeon]
MGQKKYDSGKIKRAVAVLLEYPEGLWLRRLAGEAQIPLATLHRYVEGFLAPFVENVGAKNEKGHFFGVRVVRLKAGVRKRLLEGVALDKLLKEGDVVASQFD